ncbi:EAL domain-containing protein [Novacetimonas pomaceti]|uniref:EAL domain-containing protein n=1 Tax=Novacetimonas pomaceti TaxID=2021998 RepID=UPI001EF0E79C|nr:EAL domain-containing protein [Novacetimonas pomaceti]
MGAPGGEAGCAQQRSIDVMLKNIGSPTALCHHECRLLRLLKKDGSSLWVDVSVYETYLSGERIFALCMRDMKHQIERQQQQVLFASIVKKTNHGVLVIDPRGKIIYSNAAFGRLLDFSGQKIEGHDFSIILAGAESDLSVLDEFWQKLAVRQPFELDIHSQSNAGRELWLSASITPVCDPYGEVQEIIAVLSDITCTKQIEAFQRDVTDSLVSSLSLHEILSFICRRIERIAPDVVASIATVDDDRRMCLTGRCLLPPEVVAAWDGVEIGPNAGAYGTAAYTGEEVICSDIEQDVNWKDDARQILVAHGLVAYWSTPITIRDGKIAAVLTFYFRTKREPSAWHRRIEHACVHLCALAIEQHQAQDDLARLAEYDVLTGLPNRMWVRHYFEQQEERAGYFDLTVMVVNLDHLRAVNDVFGWTVGDEVLLGIANRLKKILAPGDRISRTGGDEFTILTMRNHHSITALADLIIRTVSPPFVINDITVAVSASIGIANGETSGDSMRQLLQHADMALSQVKATERGCYRYFNLEMSKHAVDRIVLVNALKKSIEDGSLALVYQPQVDAVTGMLHGVEALARWNDPMLGVISPSRFIPLAEATGQIEALGEWSLRTACRQMADWVRAGVDVPTIAVNISALHFRNPNLPQLIRDILADIGISSDRLVVEVTESAMIDNHEQTLSTATAIRALGVGLSMDDFGTGFSSLSNLANLPLTEVKIDRSFMEGFEVTGKVHSIVTAIIRLAESLKLIVVAEGVENARQLDLLRDAGCDVIQGYFFSRPLDACALQQWISDRFEDDSTIM